LKRPFVFINCAMSADGKISSIQHRQIRISGPNDLARVDALRASCDAVMVGVGTILADDPGLRVRSKELRDMRIKSGKQENPLRIVVDSTVKTPREAKVLGDGCILAISQSAPRARLSRVSQKCEIIQCGQQKVDLRSLLKILHEKGVKRIMVEGGATLNWALIKNGLVDEVYAYIGAMLIAGENAPTLVGGDGFTSNFPCLQLKTVEKIDDGVLVKWCVSRSGDIFLE
jgi:2,5-diamino-6-(ribosylamino)-4(3H)-pyrimidinone 5'-phosphate reductase